MTRKPNNRVFSDNGNGQQAETATATLEPQGEPQMIHQPVNPDPVDDQPEAEPATETITRTDLVDQIVDPAVKAADLKKLADQIRKNSGERFETEISTKLVAILSVLHDSKVEKATSDGVEEQIDSQHVFDVLYNQDWHSRLIDPGRKEPTHVQFTKAILRVIRQGVVDMYREERKALLQPHQAKAAFEAFLKAFKVPYRIATVPKNQTISEARASIARQLGNLGHLLSR